MQSAKVSLLVVVFASLAAGLWTAGSGVGAPSTGTPSKSQAPGAEPSDQAAAKKPPPSDWEGPAGVVAGFFGSGKRLPSASEKDDKEQVAALAERAAAVGHSLDSLILLAPDPVDTALGTSFDQALAAVQEAYADDGFLLDRSWLPWAEEDARKRALYRNVPGLMLFRSFEAEQRKGKPELAAVLVVGEVPTQGIHPVAFDEAVALARRWQRAEPDKPLRILGPSLSDSADSLRRAFARLGPWQAARLVTGSALARSLGGEDFGPCVRFERVVATEEEMQLQLRGFLGGKMKWDVKSVALLTEADNAYNQPFLIQANRRDFLQVHFPAGIGRLRSAWENDRKPGSAGPEASASGVQVPKTSIDPSFADRGQPVHLLPELGTFTSATRDLAMARLFADLGSRRITYVGIFATDPRDSVFLAERLRRFAPSMIVFIIGNDLLFAHPRAASAMNGALVVGGFRPQVEERPRWEHKSQERHLVQFTGGFHEGVYRAASSLLRKSPPPAAQVWLSVIGNGTIQPIVSLPRESGGRNDFEISKRTGSKALAVAALLLALAGLLAGLDNLPVPSQSVWLLFALAAGALWCAGCVLAVLGSLPFRRLGTALARPHWKLIAAAALLVAMLWLFARAVAKLRRKQGEQWRWLAAFLLLSVALFLHLDLALGSLWMQGGADYFLERVFLVSNGLSPAVSLAWLGAALFAWSIVELRRYRMKLRRSLNWPLEDRLLEDREDPRKAASRQQALQGCVEGIRPDVWPLWVFLVPALLVALLLAVAVRPVAETAWYGMVFKTLMSLPLGLGAFSFCRFFWAWMELRRLLRWLALSRFPAGLNEKLAKDVEWNPLKAFGWRPVSLRTSALAVDCLSSLSRGEPFKHLEPRARAARRALGSIPDARLDDVLVAEIEANRKLQEELDQAVKELRGADSREAERFIALRFVSYLRYIFDHLRGLLLGALASGFPLLLAAMTYAYEPNEFVTNGLWTVLMVAVLLILVAFFQMDREVVLSAIAGTTPGRVTLNRQLVTSVLTYGLVPLLGLIAAQFPQVGRYLASLLNPMLSAFGS